MVNLNETIKNNRVVRAMYYFCRGSLRKKQLMAKAKKVVLKFGIQLENEDKVIRDMVRMYTFHGYNFDEYLCYHFEQKNEKERLAIVADWEHLGYTCKLNNKKNADLFDNKWKTYQRYQEHYGRKMVSCESESDFQSFCSFVDQYKEFIVKPFDASCGKGIQIFRQDEYPQDLKRFFGELRATYRGRFVLEELIRQSSEMAKLHPASVNTVRVPTIRFDDEVVIMHPFLRIGQHGNHVDNAGSGGIMGAVDVATGRVFAAADEYCHTFTQHPDSGENIVGFVIPRWEEAKALVTKLAAVVPDNRYTGWDLALTEKGWIMVEANRRGQFVWQIPEQKGFRDEINGYLKKLGKKY